MYRNGVKVPDCTGAPGTADPDPRVQSRVLDPDGDLHITVLTSAASRWAFGLGECPATVDPACQTGFAKGRLAVRQDATAQKLVAKLLGGPALEQTDLGNPLTATAGGTGTIVALCLHDAADQLAGELYAPTGNACGADVCWSPVGNAPADPDGPGSGYRYEDPAQSSDGLKNIVYHGGLVGKSKAIVKAAGPNLPAGITAALEGATHATMQLRAVDGECLSATLTDIKRADATSFKAK